ncbi:MAG: orotidine-5'-phosphate decarboxylase [Coriobacteriia bacterium]|nr:orotidine-5'-phosphate decarboxylase [Coriobacteriia bacterium]MCL2746461.1 orotidine-5'-phosphate decarboxylase [Coriobacteriia bacterium]MCL2870725.1 orotidine-5'-phosphate decarboxylase [Coriobacteriia bacterium]
MNPAKSKNPKDHLIIALDGSVDEALQWAGELQGHANWIKVGMTLFYQTGPSIIKEMKDLGYKVFLDLKLHDIPNQVENASAVLAGLGVDLITVHASGGRAMMASAMLGARTGAEENALPVPKVIAVTVLTSMTNDTLQTIGVSDTAANQVERLIRLSREAGTDGIVCSPHEAAMARSILGSGALVVTPGVRPTGAATGDQSRIMTPKKAFTAGASHLVIGRPITRATDRIQAIEAIIKEVEGVHP